MRIVKTSGELRQALDSARAEAEAGFGHPDLYMEKYLQNPRHIEVQILAGPRGRVIHLGERECSLQRRYQKILEETPSPALDLKKRRRLLSLALRVVRATRYENAGTVEFVMSSRGEFYYLETNKRIQVEHLISEMVTGVDIVEKQLVMASERKLDLSQDEVSFKGAAVNCRINAEDPAQLFAPNPGRVSRFVPPSGPGVRVDTALFDGASIPEYYDSLVAKIATFGLDRMEAIERMRVALGETIIDGVKTTIQVHQAILDDKRFLKGDYNTQSLDRKLIHWKPRTPSSPEEIAAVFLSINQLSHLSRERSVQRLSRRTGWGSAPQDQPLGKQALYVEGL